MEVVIMKYTFNVDENINNGRDKEKMIMRIYLFFYQLVIRLVI